MIFLTNGIFYFHFQGSKSQVTQLYQTFVLFVLLYVQANNFSLMLGCFLGLNSYLAVDL